MSLSRPTIATNFRQGLDQLKYFISLSPVSNKYRGSVEESLAYLTRISEVPDSSQFKFVSSDEDDRKSNESSINRQGGNRYRDHVASPSFPLIANLVRAHGIVVVQVYIDEEGNVIAASCKSGHPLLQAATSAAALRAKFNRTTIMGVP